MDRRDFIKSMGVAGGVATGLSSIGLTLGAAAGATATESGGTAASGGGAPSQARDALLSLLDTVREV